MPLSALPIGYVRSLNLDQQSGNPKYQNKPIVKAFANPGYNGSAAMLRPPAPLNGPILSRFPPN
jgi:hypothetical protein